MKRSTYESWRDRILWSWVWEWVSLACILLGVGLLVLSVVGYLR